MSLSREQILGARRTRKPIPIEVPEWGGVVFARVLSAMDQADIAAESENGSQAQMPVLILIKCLVDENGTPLFTDEDVSELGKEEFPVIARVFGAVAQLNGLTTKELDEAIEGFGATQAAVQPTG